MTKLRSISVWIVAAAAGVAWACAGAGPAAPTAEEARKFIDDGNETMLRVSVAGADRLGRGDLLTDDTATRAAPPAPTFARVAPRPPRASTSWICRPIFAASSTC